MQLYVLDTNFNKLALVDTFESALWIDRYNEAGEFEIYTGADLALLDYIKLGNYLIQKDSDHVMIIEQIKIETDNEKGNYFTISGRSIESILDRRIIWSQTDFNNVNLQTAIQRLLNANVISPSIAARRISNVVFKTSNDSKITSLKLTAQYTGDNLLDVIVNICQSEHIGFKMTLNASNQFVFELYAGTDRSYEQTTQNYVVFSSDFDNIINSNYFEDSKPYKNATLVAGEGEGIERKTYAVGTTSGLNRREIFTDARDLTSKDEDNNDIPINVYNEMLRQRGVEKLAENPKGKAFDGQVDSSQTFVYGEDFFIGDVVQIRNEYKLEGAARVVEYIMSENINDGISYYPTFEAIQEEVEG